jgi:hypothetical protein
VFCFAKADDAPEAGIGRALRTLRATFHGCARVPTGKPAPQGKGRFVYCWGGASVRSACPAR